jgi:uroporphyrinogen decarboxylase
MNSQERVASVLSHKEADRIAIDLGGWQSGINHNAYEEVKKILGIRKDTQISEIIQGLAVVDEEVLDRFSVDTR